MIEFANRAYMKKLAGVVFAHQPLVVDVAGPYLLFGSNRIVGSNLLLLEQYRLGHSAETLFELHCEWDDRAAVGVVLAAGGYPGSYRKGDVIHGLAAAEATGCKVFHAGTVQNAKGEVTTSGGRVLCVTALGDSVSAAQQQAYQGVSAIQWDGVEYRRDIAFRAIAREE